MGSAIFAAPVFDGVRFHAWGRASNAAFGHFTSTDGVKWDTKMVPNLPSLRTVGVTAAGHFVAVNGVWASGYHNQRFYRSEDGDTWETLATDGSAFEPHHPISAFAAGRVPSNQYCLGR